MDLACPTTRPLPMNRRNDVGVQMRQDLVQTPGKIRMDLDMRGALLVNTNPKRETVYRVPSTGVTADIVEQTIRRPIVRFVAPISFAMTPRRS